MSLEDLHAALVGYLATPAKLTISRIAVARLAHELLTAINAANDDDRHAADRSIERARLEYERWDHCD